MRRPAAVFAPRVSTLLVLALAACGSSSQERGATDASETFDAGASSDVASGGASSSSGSSSAGDSGQGGQDTSTTSPPADAAGGDVATASGADATSSADTGSLPPANDGGASFDASGPFLCNQVTGLTLTREWYEAGFENGVDNATWQLKAMEHAYVTEWANPASTFWSTPIESPCAQQSTSPDRLVFVVLSWTITAEADWETQVTDSIVNFQKNYPAVRRIDLLTVIRGPNNMLCPTPPAAGETIQMPASLDAALAAVAAKYPGFVFVGPKFEATGCADFNGGGPHLTTAGNTKAATTISAYFATH